MGEIMDDDARWPRSLYVGYFTGYLDEHMLFTLFNQIAPVMGVRLIRAPGNLYGFIDFVSHAAAQTALSTVIGRQFYGVQFWVSWALPARNGREYPPGSVWVGNLSPSVDESALVLAFCKLGFVKEWRTYRRGLPGMYLIIVYADQLQAENAVAQMAGKFFGDRILSVAMAVSRKARRAKPTLEKIYYMTSPRNTTVCVFGIDNLSPYDISKVFEQFGRVLYITMYENYAFVKFERKAHAACAIVRLHRSKIQGYQVRCLWANEDALDTDLWWAAQQLAVRNNQPVPLPGTY